jgi:hypothetical protein
MALRCSPVFIVCEKWAAGSKVEIDGYKHKHTNMIISKTLLFPLQGRKVV